MPRTVINNVEFQLAELGHNTRHETPSGFRLRLNTQKDGTSFGNFVHQLVFLIFIAQIIITTVFELMLTIHFFIGKILEFLFCLFVVIRNGEPQQKGRNNGRQQDGQHHRSVRVGVNEFIFDGKDGNHKGKFTFSRHGKPGNQTITQVPLGKRTGLRKVGHHETDGQLSDQGQQIDHALRQDVSLKEILDGDLETNGCGKEDAHKPLQQSLELSHKGGVQFVRGTKGESGHKGPHEVRGFGVVGGGHEAHDKSKHNGQFDLSMMFFGDSCEHMFVQNWWDDKECRVSTDDEVAQGRDDRNQNT
mmetsp:Transcript_12931/g.24877  ORF Transcript_12931/g.24877 Transcript_12931/m.24877 type:complete len:303 (+) Transcript_12931:944-1852(+)